ncbi:PadR family transcriptional regulator [Acutalibacter sp. 1XD8-33]|uniref:PadR family transcriptional regulator n=1 Tax=Acutalibacter sp. 1XD8-33 TaxID=2320081 RepID=UPI000EA35AD3|nr:PadR family transcriptional regulator [Acutalibacter sp. 1XD8-33]RKJ40083.1 PadR family transcriptional regulator [Acutalibacter sp. 1XD8-33]
MNLDDWKSQIKRGTLEFCILRMISTAPRYGYEIISSLEKWPILSAKESTVYPLLRRLQKEEYLVSFWQDTTQGLPPRKYYRITEKGWENLAAMSTEWENLTAAIAGMQEKSEGERYE